MGTPDVEADIEVLRSQILLAPISDMEPHIKRGAFIIVNECLDLAKVAFAIATNHKEEIQKHLQDSLICKGDEESLKVWREEKTFFNFIIVQPYVVAQKFVDLKPAPRN